MEKLVKIYSDQSDWYHIYDIDAIVASHILGFKLHERNGHEYCVGFPIESINNVKRKFVSHDVGYHIVSTGEKLETTNNKYEFWASKEITKKNYQNQNDYYSPYEVIYIDSVQGKFIIQYNNEEPLELEIGENIDPHAGIIKFIKENSKGFVGKYEEDIIKIIDKDIKVYKIPVVVNINENYWDYENKSDYWDYKNERNCWDSLYEENPCWGCEDKT